MCTTFFVKDTQCTRMELLCNWKRRKKLQDNNKRMFQHVSAQEIITLAEEKRHPLDHVILENCHFHNLMLSSHPEFKYHSLLQQYRLRNHRPMVEIDTPV